MQKTSSLKASFPYFFLFFYVNFIKKKPTSWNNNTTSKLQEKNNKDYIVLNIVVRFDSRSNLTWLRVWIII
jgi:hypothetical protein